MRFLYALFFLCLFWSPLASLLSKNAGTGVRAQCPPNANVVLTDQDDVDLHVALYPNCTLLGNVTIGTGANDITDISGLTALAQVTDLTIEGTLLTDLSGLEGLTNLSRLTVENNTVLQSLTGLGGMTTTLSSNLTIRNNPQLADCATAPVCDRLAAGGGTVIISGNTGTCATAADVSNACVANCPAQTQFLLSLYDALDGPNWSNQSGWRNASACEPCSWPYVTCDGDGNVTELFFTGSSIGGVLPATGWSALPELELFRLSSVDISGALPDELFTLPQLREVNLAFSDLTSMPAVISQADSLRILRLNVMSQLNGPLPDLAGCDSLERYEIRQTRLSGSIPTSTGSLTNLESLVIIPFSFSPSIPQVSGTIPDLANLTRLRTIQISSLEITGFDNMLASLSNRPALASIIMRTGIATPALPADLPGLPGLVTFEYASAQNGEAVRLSGSPNLRFYRMRNHAGTLTLPDTLDLYPGTGLEELDFRNSGISGRLPHFPASLDNLEDIDLAANDFRDTLGSQFDLAELDELDISNNRFTGFLPEYIGNLDVFFSNSITFDNNEFVGCYPASYTNLASGSRRLATFNGNAALRDFDSFISNPSNACRCTNPDCETLLRIYFATGFRDWTQDGGWASAGTTVSCSISNWQGVTTDASGLVTALTLPGNNLTGPLPAQLADLTNLTTLDLSGNNLEGCYPAALTDLCGITTDFSGNAALPDAGSATFFDNRFCPAGADQCGEDCPPGDVVLTSDAEIQAFLAFWPNCTDLPGSLTLTSTQVTDATGMDRFTDLPGNLTISGTALPDLDDFPNLATVEGNILISGNALMNSANLPKLLSVGGGYVNNDNVLLNDLRLPMLDSVGGDLLLRDLPVLVSSYDFNALFTVEGDLTIDNLGVITLNGFPTLDGLAGQLSINDNDELLQLALFTPSGGVSNRGALSAGPNTVGELRVFGNALLPSLSGLGDFAIAGDVLIAVNGSLSDCAVMSVCNRVLASTADVTVVGNAGGCSDVPEVVMACRVLPVTWVSFTARPVGKTVELAWATAEERDNRGFVVERSVAGGSWADLGWVAAADNGGRGTYAFTDAEAPAGQLYYRLRQVDLDGTATHHGPVTVTLTGGRLAVYPNPVVDELYLSAVPDGATEISLLDANGRALRSVTPRNGRVDVRDLKTGLYLLRVRERETVTVLRFVKQ